MNKNEMLKILIHKFQKLGLLDLKAFEIDMLKFKKKLSRNSKYDIFKIDKKLDAIYDTHTKKIKLSGYANHGTTYISDIYPKLDDNEELKLEQSGIRQYEMFDFLLDTMGEIEKKYVDISYPIMVARSSDESIYVPRQDKIVDEIETKIDFININADRYEIEIAASTLFETYRIGLYLLDQYQSFHNSCEKLDSSFIKVENKKLNLAENNFKKLSEAIKQRKIEHRGQLDRCYNSAAERLDTFNKSLNRVIYSLRESGKYSNTLEIINHEQLSVILERLNKYEYNYVDKDKSYDLFERLMQFVVDLQDENNNTDRKKSYRKINSAIKKLENGLEAFEVFEVKDIKFTSIDNFMSVGKNQVIGYASIIFERYFGIDKENTRELLNFFFSKAEESLNEIKNTNKGKNYYQDIQKRDGHIYIEILKPQSFFRDTDW